MGLTEPSDERARPLTTFLLIWHPVRGGPEQQEYFDRVTRETESGKRVSGHWTYAIGEHGLAGGCDRDPTDLLAVHEIEPDVDRRRVLTERVEELPEEQLHGDDMVEYQEAHWG